MKIVVTGALGHIGSRLIRDLASPQSELVLVDNLLTQRYASLFNLPSVGRYRFVEADIMTADLRSLFAGAHAVIHLAAITDAAGSFDHAEKVEQVNHEGARLVAQACSEVGARMVFLSTTSVYGTQEEVVDENCTEAELRPQSPYARSKLAGESLVQSMAAEGLKAVVLRFGTIFGTSPGMRFHTAVNKFCWQAVMKQPITVWTTALHQRRPYLDLGDGVSALQFVLQRDVFDGQIYNVLTTNTTVQEVIDFIRRDIAELTIKYVDSAIMNQLSYRVANQKFCNLGFEFKGDMGSGIHDTLAWLRQANR